MSTPRANESFPFVKGDRVSLARDIRRNWYSGRRACLGAVGEVVRIYGRKVQVKFVDIQVWIEVRCLAAAPAGLGLSAAYTTPAVQGDGRRETSGDGDRRL